MPNRRNQITISQLDGIRAKQGVEAEVKKQKTFENQIDLRSCFSSRQHTEDIRKAKTP